MNIQRWTLAGVAVAAIAAMVSLIDSDGPIKQPGSDPLATVLIWALGFVVVAILLNLAWTFPAFRGLSYETQDRLRVWRARRSARRWIAIVNQSTGSIALEVSAPADSDVEDEIEAELIGRAVRYTTTTMGGPTVQFGSRRLAYWAEYPGDFDDAPDTLPAGRYKVRWSDTTGHRKTARFKINKWGRLRRIPRVRFAHWRRSLRELTREREAGP